MPEPLKPEIILVLGGARSGKSRFAQQVAERRWRKPLYLATAEIRDPEMAERVRRHRESRGRRWRCVEEPLKAADVIGARDECDGILMDCVTLWLTNVFLKEGAEAVPKRQQDLIRALKTSRRDVILVSNEVGMGIVPEHELGRTFRDLAGLLNQALAQTADTVILTVAGLPLAVKGRIE